MQDGDTALFMACRFGFTAIVDILLHNGANVNTENSVNLNLKAILHSFGNYVAHTIQFGGTALHAASLGGYTDVAEMLLDFGASVDVPTEVYTVT